METVLVKSKQSSMSYKEQLFGEKKYRQKKLPILGGVKKRKNLIVRSERTMDR